MESEARWKLCVCLLKTLSVFLWKGMCASVILIWRRSAYHQSKLFESFEDIGIKAARSCADDTKTLWWSFFFLTLFIYFILKLYLWSFKACVHFWKMVQLQLSLSSESRVKPPLLGKETGMPGIHPAVYSQDDDDNNTRTTPLLCHLRCVVVVSLW